MKLCRRLLVCLALGLASLLALPGVAHAGPQYMEQIPVAVENKTCTLCHTANYPELNADGKAWVAAGKDWSVFNKGVKPTLEEKPNAEEAAKGAKELPKTGGNPYWLVISGLAALGLAGILGGRPPKKRN